MTKTRFTADLGNGKTATRTSTSMAYTHAVIINSGTEKAFALTWHTSGVLANRGQINAARYYDWVRVVRVQAEAIVPKRTSVADVNATQRGVLTRKINRLAKFLQRAEQNLAAWDAGYSARYRERMTTHYGAEQAEKLTREEDCRTRREPEWAREQIAKLEAERAALAAQA
ncbi:hypothetical protein [Microcystis phage MJing1]|nr:hypothetical protein [Microcystis phage MJing1]